MPLTKVSGLLLTTDQTVRTASISAAAITSDKVAVLNTLSAQSLDLISLPINDDVNPVIRIGEWDRTAGTDNRGFSGIFISYNETSHLLGLSAQFEPGAGVPALFIGSNAVTQVRVLSSNIAQIDVGNSIFHNFTNIRATTETVDTLFATTNITVSSLSARKAYIEDSLHTNLSAFALTASSLIFPTTFPNVTTQLAPAFTGFRNRIINGDFRINQRYAGYPIAEGSNNTNVFVADRWLIRHTHASTTTIQLISAADSTLLTANVLPAGFTSGLQINVTAGASTGTNDYYVMRQIIEGNFVRDLNFGTTLAKNITISFWVRSSSASNYNLAIQNRDLNRTYVVPFQVSVANNWEYKTFVIPGAPTGTWRYDELAGLVLTITLGGGNSVITDPNIWQSNANVASSTISNALLAGVNNFMITGVQLEAGTNPTPFEERGYNTELALCQRYFFRAGGRNTNLPIMQFVFTAASTGLGVLECPEPLRIAPSTSNITLNNLEASPTGGGTVTLTSVNSVLNQNRVGLTLGGMTGGTQNFSSILRDKSTGLSFLDVNVDYVGSVDRPVD